MVPPVSGSRRSGAFRSDDELSLTRLAVVKVVLHLFLTYWSLYFSFLHTRALAQKSPVANAILRLEPCSPYLLSPVLLIALVLPTNRLFDQCGP
jgi:hypothetical protein